jgi:hypothetical protein
MLIAPTVTAVRIETVTLFQHEHGPSRRRDDDVGAIA